jgi:carbon-monoxide dehydrogenase medium subunit
MPELKELHRPSTVEEALALLRRHGENARPLAGGTSLVFSRSSRLEVLVDLGRTGLDRIEEREDGLHVGAMARLSALRRHLEGRSPSALADAAGTAGSRVLQNHITAGGNCVMAYSWSDLPVAALALGARFTIEGVARRTVEAEAFFAEHPSRQVGTGELLVEISVPRPLPGEGSAYLKFRRTDMDHALASAAALLSLEDGVVRRARIVAGAVRGLPQLLPAAAAGMVGRAPDGAAVEAAALAAAQEAKVTADFRATAEFRKQLLASLVEDVLLEAAGRARGER